MEHNLISFHDVADKLFKLFTVGETLMSSHENADRVKKLMGEINIAYDIFNSLCPQSDNLELPGNVFSKVEFDTKYWVFKQTVQQWFDSLASENLKVNNAQGKMSQGGDNPLSIPEVGKLWPAGQMWPAERFLWPAARPRTQSTLLDFFR